MQNTDFERLYTHISKDVARRIRAGEFVVGDRLPAERVLAENYKVSRPTVREAVIALEVDGLVEVRMGAGVFVTATTPKTGHAAYPDMGPFELLEARRSIEGEAAALAAVRIKPDMLVRLEDFATVMRLASPSEYEVSEQADREFHVDIARATENSGMVAAVEMLWEARLRSPQYQLMSKKAHEAGIVPRFDEHRAICEALKAGDPIAARDAMRSHISRVLDSFMELTEIDEIEQVRQRVAASRSRFAGQA